LKINSRDNRLFLCCLSLILSTVSGCLNQTKIDNLEKDKKSARIEDEQIIKAIDQQQNSLNLCNQEQDPDLSADSVQVYQLNEREYLVEILCFLGAYQPNHQYFVTLIDSPSNFAIKPIFFTTFKVRNKDLQLTNSRTLTGIANFEPDSKSLIIETKGRGLGDCGSFAIYQWENNNFQLKEYRYKGNCDGIYLNPEDYPLIYP
jgi:hypothetical protein